MVASVRRSSAGLVAALALVFSLFAALPAHAAGTEAP